MNLVLLSLLVGQAPQIAIDAPDKVDYGMLIVCRPSNAETDIGWMVMEPVEKQYETFGNTLVMASGCKQEKIILLAVDWDNRKLQRIIVTVGDDKPEPNPPPGKRKVRVIYESADSTPQLLTACLPLQTYCLEKQHSYLRVDKDAKGPEGQQPAWLLTYLDIIRKSGVSLPAIIVTDESNNLLCVKPMPATGQEAINLLKEQGG